MLGFTNNNQDKLYFGTDTFELTGTYFGVLLKEAYDSHEMIPVCRVSYSNSANEPEIVYALFYQGYRTTREFCIFTSHRLYGWCLEGKNTKEFLSQKYFSEVKVKAGWNSIHTVECIILPLVGNEEKYIVNRNI